MFEQKYNGVSEDKRPEDLKAKDWDSREIAMGSSTGSKITELTVKYYDQMQSSACTVHSFLSMLEYNKVLKVDVSRFPLYRKRIGFPFEGSNIFDILLKTNAKLNSILGGLTLYEDINHPRKITEKWANSLDLVQGKDLVDFEYYSVKNLLDLERIVNSGIAVSFGIYGSISEWRKEYVTIEGVQNPWAAQVRHQITMIPKGAFIENGVLWFSVIDSSKFGNRNIRYVSIPFIISRPINVPVFAIPKDAPTPPTPPVNTLPLVAVKLNDRGVDVGILQAFLAEQGFLDKKYVTSFYGNLTAKAVLWFQLFNHKDFEDDIPTLLSLKGEYWGRQSIKAVNKK